MTASGRLLAPRAMPFVIGFVIASGGSTWSETSALHSSCAVCPQTLPLKRPPAPGPQSGTKGDYVRRIATTGPERGTKENCVGQIPATGRQSGINHGYFGRIAKSGPESGTRVDKKISQRHLRCNGRATDGHYAQMCSENSY